MSENGLLNSMKHSITSNLQEEQVAEQPEILHCKVAQQCGACENLTYLSLL